MQTMLACLHSLGLSIKDIDEVIQFVIEKDDYKIIKQIVEEYDYNEMEYINKHKKLGLN